MRERLGYVCNPRSLKEGTETSRPVATAPVPPLSGRAPARLLSENLNMRAPAAYLCSRCDQRQLDAIIACQCALARLVYTRSGLVSLSDIPIRRSSDVTSPFPPSGNEGYIRNRDVFIHLRTRIRVSFLREWV